MGEKRIAFATALQYYACVQSHKIIGLRRAFRGPAMLPDNETISKLLGGLYDAAADPTLWNPFLERLARETGARSAGLVMLDLGQEVFTISRSWEVDPEANRLYQEYYGPLDVWAQRGLSKPAGYVCNSEALNPLAEMALTEIYNDFMVRFSIEHGMFGVVENSRSCWASISLYRDSSRPAFHDPELQLLQFLAPHMQRAFKLHFRFSELKGQSAGYEATLDMLATGVIFLGFKGEVLLQNRSATAFVAERDGLLASRAGLRAERQAESDLLTKTILEACSTSISKGPPTGGNMLVSRRGRPPLQILVCPIRNSSIGLSQAVAAVAFVNDPLQQQRPPQEVLRVLYGLSPAESRVALLLGDGHAPRKIAEIVGVTDNTVRSQIKSIFSKTGVKRQGELVRLLLGHSGLAIQSRPTR
jgi:DNA-binding CsgD family transcriptional regulator